MFWGEISLEKDIKERLETYLNGMLKSVPKARTILHHILKDSRWAIFSALCKLDLSAEEKKGIETLVQKTCFVTKEAAKIQIKVKTEFESLVQKAFQSILEDIEEHFKVQIGNALDAYIDLIFDTKNEEALARFQENLSHIFNSIKALTYEAFTLPLTNAINFSDPNGKKLSEMLEFLSKLLPEVDRKKFPSSRKWTGEAITRKVLNKRMTFLSELTKQAEVTFQEGKLVLKGFFPKVAQVNKYLATNTKELKEVEIYGYHTVTINEDLVFQGVNVTVIAPWR